MKKLFSIFTLLLAIFSLYLFKNIIFDAIEDEYVVSLK